MLPYPATLLLSGIVYFGARLAADLLLDALFPWCDHPTECFDYASELRSSIDDGREPCDSLYDHTCAFWNQNHPRFVNQFELVSKKIRVQMYRHLEAASMRQQSPMSIRDKTVRSFRKCQEVFTGRTENAQVILDVFKRLSFEWPSLDLPRGFDALDVLVALSLDFGLGYVLAIEPVPYMKTDARYALVLGIRESTLLSLTRDTGTIRRCVDAVVPGDSKIPLSLVAHRIHSTVVEMITQKVIAKTTRSAPRYVPLRHVANLTSPTLSASQWLSAINNHLDVDRQVSLDDDVLLGDTSMSTILKAALRGESTTVDLMLAVGWATIQKLSFGTSHGQIDCMFKSDILTATAGCLALVDELLPFPLALFFFDAVQPAAVVNTTAEMMRGIQEATKKSFKATSWMDAHTARGARERVETIEDVINLPDHLSCWEDIEAAYDFVASFSESTFIEGYLETRAKRVQATKRLLVNGSGVSVHREEFASSMIRTNAFYAPLWHLMVIPGGILFPPFVMESAPAAINYGGIGRVLGHELTHAFDREYGTISRTGDIHDWYSNDSRKAFEEKLQCIVDKVTNSTGSRSWAQSSLAESFADTAGVEKAYLVYEEATSGPGMTGYTADQLFFLSGCFIFCGRERQGMSTSRIYPPLYLRCDLPAANLDRFAEAFHCRRNSPLNPTVRCDFH